MRRALFAFVLCVAAVTLATFANAQQVGPNVNVLAGTDPRTGDAYLQRQNEATIAVSTRNSDHIIVAMNDYRTVDIAYDTTPPGQNNGFIARALRKLGVLGVDAVRAQTPTPEAWIGLAASRDRGRTWYNFLLPGYPQDPTAVGQASPVYGDDAGSDPVFLTGQHGRVYLIALTFDRGGISRMSATRWTDPNNVEGAAPWHFDFTKQIDRGSMSSKGVFVDKPSAAAYAASDGGVFGTSGVSKKKKQEVVVPGCERLYVAFTRFDGNDTSGTFRSSVYTSFSASCGDVWSTPTKVSGPYSINGVNYPGTRNQGTAVAVDPDSGAVYVLWRTYNPNGFVIVRSTDGGATFSAPKPITQSPVYLYDQPLLTTNDGTNAVTFRANDYPSLMVYDGRLVAVWSEKVDTATGLPAANGVPRTVMSIGTANADGSITWTPRWAIDLKDDGAGANTRVELEIGDPVPVPRPTGAQVMPFVTGRDGQVAVVYYEARDGGPDVPGGIAKGTGYISGIDRQVDARVALINPDTWATTSSFQISRYEIDPATGRIKEVDRPGLAPQLKRQVNYANYPMYRGGIAAFIGDYLHGVPLRPDGAGPGFRFVFTSNELVVPPLNLDFTQYSKPGTGDVSTCNPGSRNSTIMTTEVGTGLVVGSPGTFKQLVDADGKPIQRAFAVYVENHTDGVRAFHLTVDPVSAGVVASFEQFGATKTLVDVELLPSSSVTRTVYLTGNLPTGSAVVTATEYSVVNGPNGLTTAASLGLTASLTLNGDSTNPPVGASGGNPGLAADETHTPQVSSPQVGSPQVGSPQISSPQVGSPQIASPQVGSPQVGSPQVSSPQVGSTGVMDPKYTDITFKVTNAGNTASAFNTLVTLALEKLPGNFSGHQYQVFVYRVNQTAAVQGCAVGQAQVDQVVYMTPQVGSPQVGSPQVGSPQVGSPQVGSPQVGSPQVGSPQVGSPQVASASFSVAPADPTAQSASAVLAAAAAPTPAATVIGGDGTERQQQASDAVMLTIRIIHPDGEDTDAHGQVTNPTFFQNAVTEATAVAVQAQAVDTAAANAGQTTPDIAYIDNIPPVTTVTATTSGTTATFTFTGSDNVAPSSVLTFQCQLDGGGWAACTSPASYSGLSAGIHAFSVYATDPAGNIGAPAFATVTITGQGPTVAVVNVVPSTAAAGYGQMITVFTQGDPSTGTPTATFTQNTTSVQGWVYPFVSIPNRYYVRLPFVGDQIGTTTSLTAGFATVRLDFPNGTGTTQPYTLTVASVPGAPEARSVFGLTTPPPAGNGCGLGLSNTPTTTIYPGQGIAISAWGTDTSGARAVFTQGGTSVEVASGCTSTAADFVAATFVVPTSLQPGPVTVQLKTTVMTQGTTYESGLSNALSLTVVANPAGGALQFDGVDDVVSIPHNASLNLTDLTIEGWVKIDSYDFLRSPLVSKGAQNFGNYTFSVLGSQTQAIPGTVELAYAGVNLSSNWSCGDGVVPLGIWTHIAVTLSNRVCTIYVNGTPGTTHPQFAEGPTANTDPLLLGRVAFSTVFESFTGSLDEVRVWNVARSSADIGANYNSTVPGNSNGLVGYWQFNEATGTGVLDSSSAGNNGLFGTGAAAPTRVASSAPIIR